MLQPVIIIICIFFLIYLVGITAKIQNSVHSPSVAENIKNFDPNVKIINVMCDPVRRIYSDFLHINRETPTLATMDRFQSQVLEGIANIQQKQQRIDNENLSWEYLWHEEDFKFVTRTMTSFSKVILRSCYSIFIKTWSLPWTVSFKVKVFYGHMLKSILWVQLYDSLCDTLN